MSPHPALHTDVSPGRLQSCDGTASPGITVRSGEQTWSAVGISSNSVPLRHRQDDKILRIVKSPTDWTFGDGRQGSGMCAYHDLLDDGVRVSLAE